MAQKKKKRGFISVSIVSLFFTMMVMYFIVSWLQVWEQKLEFETAIMSIKGKLDYFQILDYEKKVIIYIATAVIFVVTLIFLRKDNSKGYQDATWHGVHGNSRFFEPQELRELGYASDEKNSKYNPKNPFVALEAEEGIICGVEKDKKQMLIIPNDTKLDNRNVLVVGSSGSSKGQGFIITNILNQKTSSIIVTDPKGELYNLTHEIKRDQGYKVMQIDFMNLTGNRHNPLDYVTDDIEAKNLALTMARNAAKDDKEDHWFAKAVDLLTGLIIYVKDVYPNPSIPIEIKSEFAKASEDEEYLIALVEEIGLDHPASAYLKDASIAKGSERSGIFSTFTKITSIFSSPKVREMTIDSDFHFSELQEQPTIMYVKIPIKNNPVAALTATFFDQLIGYLYKYGDANLSQLDIPTIILFDEFANIGKINGYDEVLTTCRGYLLSIITIIQNIAQLEVKYGKDLARTIVDGHAAKILLKTGDVETAKYFESLAGPTTVSYSTKSTSSGGGLAYILDLTKSSSNGGVNKSEHYSKKNLLDYTELLQIDKNNLFAFIDGKPIALNKAFQSVVFNGLLTKEVKQANGVSKFPYIYPEIRGKYIEKFNLKPFKDKDKIVPFKESSKTDREVREPQRQSESPNIMPFNETLDVQPVKVAEEVKSSSSENMVLDSLISEFLKPKVAEEDNTEVAASDTNLSVPKPTNEKSMGESIQSFVEKATKAVEDGFEVGSYAAVKELKNIDEVKMTLMDIDAAVQENTELEELKIFFDDSAESVEIIESDGENDNEIVEIEDLEELPM